MIYKGLSHKGNKASELIELISFSIKEKLVIFVDVANYKIPIIEGKFEANAAFISGSSEINYYCN